MRSVETKKGSSRVEKTGNPTLKVTPTNYLQRRQLRLALVSKMFKLIPTSSAKSAEEPPSGIISDILQETFHNAQPNPNRKDNNNLTKKVED